MALEPNFDYIDNLNPANPDASGDDPVGEGDNHLRGIKEALRGNVRGSATQTSLRASGANRWFTQSRKAWLASDQTTESEAQVGLLGKIGVALFTSIDAAAAGGVRLLSAAGATGVWLIRGTAGAAISAFTTGKVMAFVDSQVGLGVERDGAAPEFVSTDSLAAVQLRGMGVEDLGLGSAGSVRDIAASGDGTKRPVGFNALPIEDVTAAFTVLARHSGRRIRLNPTENITLTVETGIPEGWTVILTNRSAFDVLISHGGTTELYGGNSVTTGAVTLGGAGVVTLTMGAGNVLEVYGVKATQ